MKVMLMGGLGYIGSALSERYRQREDVELLVVDKRCVPEQVVNLPPNATYIQADLGDLDRVLPLAVSMDVVHLLAAEVEAESSGSRAAVMWEQNYVYPTEFMRHLPNWVHVCFPSSANVFGGNAEPEEHVFTDPDLPQPRYPYAQTKAAVEDWVVRRQLPHTLFRFGTNYGWASGMRWNLVVNAFALRALQGMPLTLHGDGSNYRPFCATMDCARALVWAADHPQESQGRLFHCVSENYRIREIATAVVESVAKVPIKCVEHVQEFASYRLASPALLGTGFQFQQDLPRALADLRDRFRSVR